MRSLRSPRCDPPEVACFDLFDTLIVRPFVRPTDLFRLIEEHEGRQGFAEARISAEKEARRVLRREVSIDDIYSYLEDGFDDLLEVEIEAETAIAIPDPDVVGILKDLSSEGSRVAVVSDMYLPRTVLEGILSRCGIPCDRLFVSSEYGESKHSGGLFRIVSEETGVPFDRMSHIGDNPRSDRRVPRSLGIDATCRPSRIDTYLRTHPDQRRFYERTCGLDRSVIVSMDMLAEAGVIGSAPSSSWRNLGRRYGGPLAYAYSEHLSRTIRPDSVVLFASRDGYTPMRIISSLRGLEVPGTTMRYAHIQRIISYVLSDDGIPYGPMDVPSRRRERFRHDRAVSWMRYVIGFLKDDLGIDAVPSADDDVVRMYGSRIDEIDSLRRTKAAEYRGYLSSMCGDGSVDIVDSTTMRFTSQRLLQEMIRRSAVGHYLVALADSGLPHTSFGRRRSPVAGWTRVNIPEFLLCSPEPPLRGWSGGPVFEENPPAWEKERMDAYPEISDGELEYALGIERVFGRMLPGMSYGSVAEWSMLSVSDPSIRPLLDRMRWASAPDHSDWMHLVPRTSDVPAMLKRIAADVVSRLNRGSDRSRGRYPAGS